LTDYPNLEGFKKAVTEILNFGNHLLYKRQLASGVFREVKKLQEIGRLLQEASRLAESGKSKLRFQALYLGVYEIADQYFCEKRVELARKHGELETEEMRLGEEAHEALTEGLPTIQQEEVWRRIIKGEEVILNMQLIAKWKGVIILGRPDTVYFRRGQPFWLFEYKFTKSRIPQDSHHAQARIYSLILDEMGFNTNKLTYAIVLGDPKLKDHDQWKHLIFPS